MTLMLALPVCCAVGCSDDDNGNGAGDADTDTDTDTDTDDPQDAEALAIAGEYDDNWGGLHVITQIVWSMNSMGLFHIESFDNGERVLIALNDEDNSFNAGLWSRFDWTVHDDDLYYCQTAYDAATAEDAAATSPADATDPADSGCGGFAWTRLDADALEIAGSYTDTWSDTHTITNDTWTTDMLGAFHIAAYYNTSDYLIARNDEDNSFNAGLWSRFDWTVHNDDLYYCQIAYDAGSAAAAEAAGPADATDPADSGCNGFAWSELISE